MAADTSPSKSSVPPFSCRLPPSLLDGLPDFQRELYERNDRMDQKLDWLVDQTVALGSTLGEVKEQTLKTNGRMLTAESDIKEIKTEITPVVKAYGVGAMLAKSRVFWVGAAAFAVIGLPWLISIAPAPIAFVRAAITVLLGV